MILVTCECGNAYQLKDEYAGRQVKCPNCGRVNRADRAASSAMPQADPVFDRDIFLLRQKLVAIDEKYHVSDDKGAPLIYVERPRHLIRNLAAVFAGVVVAFFAMAAFLAAMDSAGIDPNSPVAGVLVMVAFVLSFAIFFAVAMLLSKKRHITFYRDENRSQRVLGILQDKKFQPVRATFTILDASERPIGSLSKNHWTTILRKRWDLTSPAGGMISVAKEDSIILSLLRRILGPFFGLLRTNYVFYRGTTTAQFGEFKRKLTILDRYVLDLSPDRGRALDRRMALALAVMLDTGERR
jgi:uncharacterized protein YxjI